MQFTTIEPPAIGSDYRSVDVADASDPKAIYGINTLNEPHVPRKKRRFVFDGVEVPRLRSLGGMKLDNDVATEADIRERLKKLQNPKVKQKNDSGFRLDTVHSRMRNIGYEPYDISLPAHILEATFSRKYLSATYGGNPQQTFPVISNENFLRHGLRNFMYLNLDYDPHAPQIPGAPGLFFECESYVKQWELQRVITRLLPGEWNPEGLYKISPAPSLTKEEWQAQAATVRNTWHKNILNNEYGRNVRARITLRKEFGREPKVREVEEATKDKSNKFMAISVDDIARAYDYGEEAIAVWCMKCIGYDEEFQRKNIDGFVAWKIKEEEKQEKLSSLKGLRPANGSDAKRRRKGVKEEIDKKFCRVQDSATQVSRVNRNRAGGGIRLRDKKELTYTPRGTRSRPS